MAFGPRDPRKTTGLIGRACKGRNAFSEAVLTVDDLISPTGFRAPSSKGGPNPVALTGVHAGCRSDALS
jgi:hypothetical protein